MKPINSRPAQEPGGKVSVTATGSSIAPHADNGPLTREQMSIVHNWLAQAVDVDRERLAFAVFVEVSEGRYRRRLYLSLASAQAAVERAEARGVDARAVMCQLVPVRGEQ